MIKKPRKLTKKQLAAKRSALDSVLAAAIAARTDTISIYDCAMWLLYACARDDARARAEDVLAGEDETEAKDRESHSTELELEDDWELAREDGAESWEAQIEHQQWLGEQLDPGYGDPILQQTDWLAEPQDEHSTIVAQHQRIVDNAIAGRMSGIRKRKR